MYYQWILDNWLKLVAHIYILSFLFLLTPWMIIFFTPLVIYAYSAAATDIDESGFIMVVCIGNDDDEEILNDMAGQIHEDSGKPVKVIVWSKK